MAHQTAANSRGEPSDLAMAAGVRKMPSAMDSPLTTAIAAVRPSCRFASITAACYRDQGNIRLIQKMDACLNRCGEDTRHRNKYCEACWLQESGFPALSH